MGWLLDQLFKFFTKDILAIGRKPVPKNKEVNPRHWQVCHGRTLVEFLNGVIRRCHMLDDFWIVTKPDQDPFVLQVFEIDGSDKNLKLQIGIGFPDFFVIHWPKEINWLDEMGNSKISPLQCPSFEQLLKESEDALLIILFRHSPIGRM